MADWSNTVYGAIVGSYGRIWIKAERTDYSTYSSLVVTVGFYSKYSVTDSNNDLYFDNRSSSGSATTHAGSFNIKTTYDSGSGWHDNNSVVLRTFTYSYTRGTSDSTRYLYAKYTGIDRVGGTMYANMTVTIPKAASYTIKYNANGGTGAPASQTKYHGKDLVLSSTIPTRTGYTFEKWDTSDGNAAYAPGDIYTPDASMTLIARWTANKYTVSYDANGGTGAPSAQTKTYGVNLTLSKTVPTRTNYTFKGWATSASGSVAYSAGSTYKTNAAVTLYAVWELNYRKPRIANLVVSRCLQGGAASDDGTYMRIKFDWACDRNISAIEVSWNSSSGEAGEATITTTGTSGSINKIISGPFNVEIPYKIEVIVRDTVDYSYASATLYGKKFAMDLLAGGEGVAFGKAAERSGFAEFGFHAAFNGWVQGNAFGLSVLPQIGENEDFNSYLNPGVYGVASHAIAGNIKNNPAGQMAGRLIVCAATGGEIKVEGWSYIQQWYIPMTFEASGSKAIYVRTITRGPNASPNYYSWLKFTATSV